MQFISKSEGESKKPIQISLGDSSINDRNADLFGFSDRAEKLTDLLYNISLTSGVCSAIVGDWGSGKTSFMQIMKDYLVKKYSQTTCSVWFTAWDPGGFKDLEDAMLYQFFKQLVGQEYSKVFNKIYEHLSWSDREGITNYALYRMEMRQGKKVSVVDRILNYRNYRAWKKIYKYENMPLLYNLFQNLKTGLGLRKTMKARAREAIGVIPKFIPQTKSYVEVADRLLEELDSTRKIKDTFKGLARWLRKNNLTVFFFIDDIDRADPACIRDVVSEIKVYVSNPRIVTVIGYDYNYVVEALKTPILPKGIDPQRFLEKIVTINLPLPKPTYTDLKVLSHQVFANFKSISQLTSQNLNKLAAKLSGNNPRRFKTLLLTFSLSVPDVEMTEEDFQSALVVCAAANMGALNDHAVRQAFYRGKKVDPDYMKTFAAIEEYGKKVAGGEKKANDLIMGIRSVVGFNSRIINKLHL